jgi:hypothetical protein
MRIQNHLVFSLVVAHCLSQSFSLSLRRTSQHFTRTNADCTKAANDRWKTSGMALCGNQSNGSPKMTPFLTRCYRKYVFCSDHRPFLTKSISAAIISAIGDLLSQWIESRIAGIPCDISWFRFNAFFVSGLVFVGPYIHIWYEQLWRIGRWMKSRFNAPSKLQTVAQVVVDQTVGVALFFPTYFFVYEIVEAILAYRVPDLLGAKLKCQAELSSVLLAQYYVWPLCNWIIFRYIPETLRVVASSIVAVFWNAYLCTRVA